MDPVYGTIFVAVLSLIGTCIGSIAGIMTAQKMTNYRIEQLEKKVDIMNTSSLNFAERILVLEKDNAAQWRRIDELIEEMKHVEDKI